MLPRALLPAAALAVVLASTGTTTTRSQPAGPAPAAAVTTETVERADVPLVVQANGTVVAAAAVAVRTRVDGAVERVAVREGQSVRRGDPLLTLDSRQNRALLAQQQALLDRDRALATRAAADLQRYRTLGGEGFAAQQRLEQAVADAAASAATVRADEALIAQTRLAIEYAAITAPLDGRVGELPLKEGAFLRAAENVVLTTVTQLDPIDVTFALPDRWLPRLLAHGVDTPRVVHVEAADDPRGPVEGKVVFLGSQVDAATGTIALKAAMANPETRLWPGQFVRVTLVLDEDRGALTVPVAAVQQGPAGPFVWVVKDGVAQPAAVRLGRVAEQRALLAEGPGPGTRVVVEGQQRLVPGARVTDRTAGATGAEARQ